MIRSLNDLLDYAINATDGVIGSVSDVYLDDAGWTVRYLVVDTGTWLPGRKVLLPASVLEAPETDSRQFPVRLTRKQVEDSPDVATERPVSRQEEETLAGYFGVEPYWLSGSLIGPAELPPMPAEPPADAGRRGDPHLRSGREITRYAIAATDGDIGTVSDLLIDDADWRVRYLLVDTGNWLPGRKVVFAPGWVESIDWVTGAVRVDLTRDQVRNSPVPENVPEVNRAYEDQLHSHYMRDPYWP